MSARCLLWWCQHSMLVVWFRAWFANENYCPNQHIKYVDVRFMVRIMSIFMCASCACANWCGDCDDIITRNGSCAIWRQQMTYLANDPSVLKTEFITECCRMIEMIQFFHASACHSITNVSRNYQKFFENTLRANCSRVCAIITIIYILFHFVDRLRSIALTCSLIRFHHTLFVHFSSAH